MPNDVEFENRIQFCHWAETPVPMISEKKSATQHADAARVRRDVAAVPLDDLVLGTGAAIRGAIRSATIRLTSITTKKTTEKMTAGTIFADSSARHVCAKPTSLNQR